MDSKKLQELDEKYPGWMDRDPLPWKAWGSWFSWGSPVGISIFFISIAIVVVLLRYAFVVMH